MQCKANASGSIQEAELPPELISQYLVPHLPLDALLALSQTSRYFRGCVQQAPSTASSLAARGTLPALHPYHRDPKQAQKKIRKHVCIQYAVRQPWALPGR